MLKGHHEIGIHATLKQHKEVKIEADRITQTTVEPTQSYKLHERDCQSSMRLKGSWKDTMEISEEAVQQCFELP